jgi:hypothetical protein
MRAVESLLDAMHQSQVYSGNGRVLKEFITHWAVGFLTVLLQSLSLQFVIVINQRLHQRRGRKRFLGFKHLEFDCLSLRRLCIHEVELGHVSTET